jgi:hypothetical protein
VSRSCGCNLRHWEGDLSDTAAKMYENETALRLLANSLLTLLWLVLGGLTCTEGAHAALDVWLNHASHAMQVHRITLRIDELRR